MKKKSTVIIVVLCACIIVLLAAIGLLLWQMKNKDDEPKKPDTPEVVNTSVEYTDLDVEDALVTEALRFIPSYLCGGLLFEFPEKSKTINDFTSVQKLNMVVSLFESDIIKTAADFSTWELNESDLEKYFADISFMDDYKPLADTSIDIRTGQTGIEGAKGVEESIIPFHFSYENGKYSFGSYGTGCVGFGNNGYYIEKESAKKNDKELIVQVRYYYKDVGEITENEDGSLIAENNYYRTKGDTTPIDKNDLTQYDHYEISYNIENDKLQLKEIKYVG